MALSLTLTTLEGLSADVAKEYVQQEDGSFRLDVTGMEDTGALKRAKDHEKKKRQSAETKVTELESQLEDLQEQITGLENSGKSKSNDAEVSRLQRQVTQLTEERDKQKNELTAEISRLNISSVADRIVGQLSDHGDLLRPSVVSRLSVVMEDGQSKVMVLDADGEESFMTEEDLIKEIKGNKKYAPILRGSQGSGSGAPGSGANNTGAKTKLSDYTGPERAELLKTNPTEFHRLSALARGQ